MEIRHLTAGARLLFIVLALGGYAMAQAPTNWIERQKIRAGWIYYSDGIQQIERFKMLGMNALITSAADPKVFDQWARESRRVGIHLFGVLGFSFDTQKAGLRRAVFGNGYESVVACPTDEVFWQRHMTDRAVALAKEGKRPDKDISGILIDFELYANAEKGGQLYYTDACYCDHCFGSFLKHRNLEDVTKQTPLAQRVKWLKDNGLFEAYHPFLQGLVRECARKMRKSVEAVRKDFFLGYYPRPHNWMLVGVAQGLGTPEHPMILWATDTYGGGGPSKIPDNWKEEMKKQDIHCYYCAGMLLRMYSAANLAANMYLVSLKGAGYWLFTVHTLCIREEEQSGDYYLAAGTPEEYCREIRRANDELDKYCADHNYKTSLTFVEEPVRYRHVGYDVARFKLPSLTDNSSVERDKELLIDPYPLIGTQYLMMLLQPQDEPVLRFNVDKTKAGEVWGVSYAVLDPHKIVIASGKMPPGEEFTLKFRSNKAGLHTVVLTAGYYGRCMVTSTTVPFALSTQGALEVSQPGGKVYFYVPQGMERFELSAQCNWGTNAVKLTIYTPDGFVALEQETDPYVRSAKPVVQTHGKTGLWALNVAAVPKQSFRSVLIKFDKALPPCVTLSPKFIFR